MTIGEGLLAAAKAEAERQRYEALRDKYEREADRFAGLERIESTEKATNPKDAIAGTKLPLHLWPNTATVAGTLALLDGALKYGRMNWRVAGVRASVYYDAARRHLDAWLEGEDFTSDSQVAHLGHALACLAILVDAGAAGKVVDDRLPAGGYHRLTKRSTPTVARLRKQHADKDPHHYTIKDTSPIVTSPGDVHRPIDFPRPMSVDPPPADPEE